MANEQEKEAASRASVKFVEDGQVVGLGTGSTAAFAVQFIGDRVKSGLKIRGIPTSTRTREMATKLGIPLTSFDEVQQIDVTIDGADEFDPQLNLIKGGGGALLYEKVVASASSELVIVADSSKQVPMLGSFPGARRGDHVRAPAGPSRNRATRRRRGRPSERWKALQYG